MRKIRSYLVVAALCVSVVVQDAPAQAKLKTKNVVVITTDGVRWEDIFRGPDESLMNREVGGIRDAVKVKAEYLRTGAEECRKNWLPFFWETIAKHGQLYGNQDKGSAVRITNTFRFSYPGYNEIFTGRFDPQINTNDFGPNPNVTVFEWLNQMPEFKGKVAAFGAWFAFPNIFNRERSQIFARGQWEPPTDGKSKMTADEGRLDELYRTTVRQWSDEVPDSFLHAAVKDHIKRHRPRVLFVGYGETDKWAHLGRFDQHLRSGKLVDQFIAELWMMMQSMPQYRGSTTFIITTDHGRGQGLDWKNHGDKIAGAENIWMAVLGPDTPALGERSAIDAVTQSQVAATVAALLGKDYQGAMKVIHKEVGAPLAEAIKKP